MMQILMRTAFFLVICIGVLVGRAASSGEPGESAVLKWRDGDYSEPHRNGNNLFRDTDGSDE